MTYNQALDYLMPAYDEMVTTTLDIDAIESTLVAILVRRGCKRDSARRFVRMFLDN